jgi:hypothetical protein
MRHGGGFAPPAPALSRRTTRTRRAEFTASDMVEWMMNRSMTTVAPRSSPGGASVRMASSRFVKQNHGRRSSLSHLGIRAALAESASKHTARTSASK